MASFRTHSLLHKLEALLTLVDQLQLNHSKDKLMLNKAVLVQLFGDKKRAQLNLEW